MLQRIPLSPQLGQARRKQDQRRFPEGHPVNRDGCLKEQTSRREFAGPRRQTTIQLTESSREARQTKTVGTREEVCELRRGGWTRETAMKRAKRALCNQMERI